MKITSDVASSSLLIELLCLSYCQVPGTHRYDSVEFHSGMVMSTNLVQQRVHERFTGQLASTHESTVLLGGVLKGAHMHAAPFCSSDRLGLGVEHFSLLFSQGMEMKGFVPPSQDENHGI